MIQVRVNGAEPVALGDGAIFGRSTTATLTIPAEVVSRKHAQLRLTADGWQVGDLASANGLYGPNGRAETVLLNPGVTTFSLGPPTSGCTIEASVPIMEDPATVVARSTPPSPPPSPALAGTQRAPSGPGAVPVPPRPRLQSFATAAGSQPLSASGSASYQSGLAVRAEGLSVVVDDGLVILNNASLSIPGGTMTAIVGPSGCGKSTLANLLSGRTEPTAGQVIVGGQEMTPELRSTVGVVPQYDAVHERLTVRHALTAAAKLRLSAKTSSAEIKHAVERTADVLGLTARLNTRIAKLSGGQKKRVSVGYELVSNPPMIVLDEPTSGLDPGLEQELITELRDLANRGTTTIVVTHSTEAAQQADLVVVMAPGGYVAFIGPPAEVLEHFGTTKWAEVFKLLTAAEAERWAAYFTDTAAFQRHVLQPPPSTGVTPAGRPDRVWIKDFAVMTGRYSRSILADPRALALLAAQAPVLGIMFAFVLSDNVFGRSLRPSTAGREFVLAVVLAMVWIGASNSIREIVKERSTFLRERAVGVSASSLVASRWIVLAFITSLQAIILYGMATSRQQVGPGGGNLLASGVFELVIALAIVGFGSVGIGLVLSGSVRDSNKALALLPIVLIPIVLFSGLLIPTSGKVGLEQISYINPVQWPSSAAAVTTNVLAKEGCNPSGLEAQLQQALLGGTIACNNPRWQPTAGTQAINFLLSGTLLAGLVVLSFWVTRRSTRNARF